MIINIDTDEVVVFTNKLHAISKSALPQAIRATLNGTAMDVKKNTMPKQASEEFTQRNPNFFKANSRVDFARGNDIRLMESTVGFIAKDQAVEDLEEQEYGGTIESRSFIPMDTARVGGTNQSKLRPSNRISKVKKVVNSNTMQGATPQSKFRAAVKKAGVGGYVIGNNASQTLWRIESIDGSNVKMKPLFSYKKGRTVHVSETKFMRTASMESGEGMNKRFIQEAEKIFDRLYK